jgi:hypothetical protein
MGGGYLLWSRLVSVRTAWRPSSAMVINSRFVSVAAKCFLMWLAIGLATGLAFGLATGLATGLELLGELLG